MPTPETEHRSDTVAVPVNSPARTGPLLRATTLATAVAELAVLAFPHDPDKQHAVRHYVFRIRQSEMERWQLAAAATAARTGRLVQLRPELWPAVTMSHKSRRERGRRRRAARLFGLPQLTAPYRRPPWWYRLLTSWTTDALSALAAAGPLYLDDIIEALTRVRKNYGKVAPPHDDLLAALTLVGAICDPVTGKWTHPADADPQLAAVIEHARASGQVRHTYQQVTELLKDAGYNETGIASLVPKHVLIVRVKQDHYRILGVE